MGRIFVQSLYPGWQVTADVPSQAAIDVQAKPLANCPIIYVDEFNSPAWTVSDPNMVQSTMDRYAEFLRRIRISCGPKPRLVIFGYPVYGDAAQRNVVLPWLWATVTTDRAQMALRSTMDIANNRSTPSKLHDLLGGAGLGAYWTGISNQYIENVTDAQAYADSLDMDLQMCRIANLRPVIFARIVSPIDRMPMPLDVWQTLLSKAHDCDVVVWEDETPPPADAPVLKFLIR